MHKARRAALPPCHKRFVTAGVKVKLPKGAHYLGMFFGVVHESGAVAVSVHVLYFASRVE